MLFLQEKLIDIKELLTRIDSSVLESNAKSRTQSGAFLEIRIKERDVTYMAQRFLDERDEVDVFVAV